MVEIEKNEFSQNIPHGFFRFFTKLFVCVKHNPQLLSWKNFFLPFSRLRLSVYNFLVYKKTAMQKAIFETLTVS